MKDVIIVGQGPAGLSAALYACRAKCSTLIIGKGGGALEKADRIENYFGLKQPLSGKELLAIGRSQALSLGAELVEDEVVGISVQNDGFSVDTIQSRFEGKTVILATGAPRKIPAIRGIADFEGRGVSYCAVCDAFFFRGKDVGVLGSGPYALHELEFLLPMVNSAVLLTDGIPLETAAGTPSTAAQPPKMGNASASSADTQPLETNITSAQPPEIRNAPASSIGNTSSEVSISGNDANPDPECPASSDSAKTNIHSISDDGEASSFPTGTESDSASSFQIITDKIAGLSGGEFLETISFENGKKLKIDGLFVALGTAGALDLARKLGIAVQSNAIAVDENMSTNIPGFFAAGDCIGGLLQVSTAVAEGAKAAMSAINYLRSHAK